MSVACSHLDPTIGSLRTVVAAGAPVVGGPVAAGELIDAVELARRLAAVAAVDAMQQIHESRAFYEHGHRSAAVMWAHISGESGAEAHRLDKIRRMVTDPAIDQITPVWRAGKLPVAKAALLGRAYANPRSRARFMLDQRALLKRAAKWNYKRFERHVASWIELHDHDGPEPPPDLGHERRDFNLTQDHFSTAWKGDLVLGSLDGSDVHETWLAYVEAEFAKDWARAEQLHGNDTCIDVLERTPAQRRADALVQIFADAVNSDKPSAPVKRVHNIVWTAESFEEALRRWVNAPARMLDPDSYQITDIDGHRINIGEAFADMLVSSIRRVVQDAAGVTIDMSPFAALTNRVLAQGLELACRDRRAFSSDSVCGACGANAYYPEAGRRHNSTACPPANGTTASKNAATPSTAVAPMKSPSPPQPAKPSDDQPPGWPIGAPRFTPASPEHAQVLETSPGQSSMCPLRTWRYVIHGGLLGFVGWSWFGEQVFEGASGDGHGVGLSLGEGSDVRPAQVRSAQVAGIGDCRRTASRSSVRSVRVAESKPAWSSRPGQPPAS